MNRLLLFLSLGLSPGAARADDVGHYNRSSTGAPFLRLGGGARGIAMGEAFTALSDDASAVFWNPAGLIDIEKRSATFMHVSYLDSISFDFGAYAQNLGKDYGAAGASFQFLSAGQITQTDIAGVEQGSFGPRDFALALSYAYRFSPKRDADGDPLTGFDWLNGYTLGASLKYVRSQILAHAQSGTGDIGLLSPRFHGGKLRLAFVLQNIGGVLKYDKENEILPLVGKAALAFKFKEFLLLDAEGVFPRDADAYGALGAEYRHALSAPWLVMGRLGFNSSTLSQVSGITGVSAGVGLGYPGYELDYAFVPFGSLGATHQVSVSAKF